MAHNSIIEAFINQEPITDEFILGLSAGRVWNYDGRLAVGHEQIGAQETFSVGQPIYDKDNNLMGYLEIGVLNNLNVSVEGKDFHGEDIPSFYWGIGKPTKHCEKGKKVYTYWQRWKEVKNESTNNI
jgi:hypothetical protein